jgi:hypothetical protein
MLRFSLELQYLSEEYVEVAEAEFRIFGCMLNTFMPELTFPAFYI